MHCAAEYGRLSVVQTLLTAGADVNIVTKVSEVWYQCIIDACNDWRILCHLICDNIMCVYLQKGNETALHYAASRGHVSVVQALLTGGADINKCDSVSEVWYQRIIAIDACNERKIRH